MERNYMELLRWLFPGLLVAINFGAAVMSAKTGDWKKAVYWLSSAVCLAMVAWK